MGAAVFSEPLKVVADTRLACLEAWFVWNDAIHHNPAHTRYDLLAFTDHHMACGCTHDHHHTAAFGYRRCRPRGMRIYISYSYSGASFQTSPCSCLRGKGT